MFYALVGRLAARYLQYENMKDALDAHKLDVCIACVH